MKPPPRDFDRFTGKWGFIIFQELSNFYCPPAKPGVYIEEIIYFMESLDNPMQTLNVYKKDFDKSNR